MRTEAEIRQHRNDLHILMNAPCGCTGGHAQECEKGKMFMGAAVELLDWALGHPHRNEVMHVLHHHAEKIRRGPGLG